MSCVPYVSAIESVMYAILCIRLDIVYGVRMLSKYMLKPRNEHWTTIKGVLRYLHGNIGFGLCY